MINVFNHPTFDRPKFDDTIIQFILNCFRACTDGSSVVGSFMNWAGKGVDAFTHELDEIIKRKNLECILIVGDDEKTAGISDVVREFITRHGGVAELRQINREKNHSKFLIFESMDFSIVASDQNFKGPAFFLGSSNFGEMDKFNAATLVELASDDLTELRSYFLQRLYKGAKNPPFFKPYKSVDVLALNNRKHTSLHLYPGWEHDKTKHPYEHMIGTRMVRADSIKIVTPRFRDKDVATAIRKKLNLNPNLKVTIISRKQLNEVPQEIRNILAHPRCKLLLHDNNPNCHSKYMLFSGTYSHGTQPPKNPIEGKILWTGTMNITGARHHWEQILKTLDPKCISDYEADFERLKGLV